MKKSILELTDNEVIHAPTLEIAEKLCKRFDELGLRWNGGYKYNTVEEDFNPDGTTCFNPASGRKSCIDYYRKQGKTILTISDLLDFDEPILNPQSHYDNTHGSLYLIAQQRGWNAYQFDIIKRIDRCNKKGQFKEDLQKTKDLIDLYLQESN